MLKKLLASLLLATFLLTTFFVPHVKAEGNWYNQSFQEWYAKVHDDNNPQEIFGERYTSAQVEWIIWSALAWLPTKIVGPNIMICVLSGDVGECIKGLTHAPNVQNNKVLTTYSEESLLKSVFAERPLSGITYFKNWGRKLNLIPEAKAQSAGFGFLALKPILEMWKASRNIAYALFVLIIVALAFMIMFRVKISPQVIITVQSALPKIVLALILITFSYAIAGFLVDLMYVVIGLISLIGTQFFPFGVSSTVVFNFLTKGQPWALEIQAGVLSLFILYLILFLIGFILLVVNFLGAIQVALLGAIGVALGSLITATGIGALIGLLLLVLLIIVLLWMFVKIFWMLIKTYANLLLLIIFAPFQIAFGALMPTVGFTKWLRSFISNLAVFVVVGTLFLLSFSFLFQAVWMGYGEGLGKEILDTVLGSFAVQGASNLLGMGSSSASWPPLLGFGESGVPILLLGVSFVIFTLIPSAGNMIKALLEGKPFAYGAAIGELVAPAKFYAGQSLETLGRGYIPSPIDRILKKKRTSDLSEEGGETIQRGARSLYGTGKIRGWWG
jgi:hypothetical protein